MLAYGFKHMQAEGATSEEITKTIRVINSALWQFSDVCINNGDISHSTNEENQ